MVDDAAVGGGAVGTRGAIAYLVCLNNIADISEMLFQEP
jgi:hypothetical protein